MNEKNEMERRVKVTEMSNQEVGNICEGKVQKSLKRIKKVIKVLMTDGPDDIPVE